jgi:hypothetical protein
VRERSGEIFAWSGSIDLDLIRILAGGSLKGHLYSSGRDGGDSPAEEYLSSDWLRGPLRAVSVADDKSPFLFADLSWAARTQNTQTQVDCLR